MSTAPSEENRQHSAVQVPLSAQLLGWFFASLLKLFFLTWRKSATGLEAIDKERAAGSKMMLCFWHGHYVPIFALCGWQWVQQRGETACAFTSLSPRGIVIGEICRQFGLSCVQIPDNGRKQSFELMHAAMRTHSTGVIAVDGPLGPKGKVKQGAIRLASELGYLLVPAGVWSSHKWVMQQRWDKMEFPKPFSRAALAMGAPIEVSADIDKAGIRSVMQELATSINKASLSAQGLGSDE